MAFWKKGLIAMFAFVAVGVAGHRFLLARAGTQVNERAHSLRQIAADLFWLKAYGAWEAKSEEDFRYYSGLALRADSGRWFFIQESIGVLAYDLPVWRVGHGPELDEEKRIQALAVLKMLDEVKPQFGSDYRWYLERGLLELHQLRDEATAKESFRAAALSAGAPQTCLELYMQLESDPLLRQEVWDEWLAGQVQRSSSSK